MATKTYKWKADTTYQSDTVLSYGVLPTDHTGWQTAQAGTQSGSWTYWYRDGNYGPPFGDGNSSRVAISLTESWTATINSRNYLTVTIRTTINSVVRDGLQGSNPATPGRAINIYREQGGSPILSLADSDISSAHTIFSGPATLDLCTFTLAPGESLQRSSLYLHNQTIGYASYDDIWFGVMFMNDLPKEAIPHAILGPGGQWLSHNRDGGDLRLHNGSGWSDNLPNVEWGEGYGDPPSVLKDGKWLNARVIGKED